MQKSASMGQPLRIEAYESYQSIQIILPQQNNCIFSVVHCLHICRSAVITYNDVYTRYEDNEDPDGYNASHEAVYIFVQWLYTFMNL